MNRIARRAAGSVVMLLVVSILAFALLEMSPGDFFTDLRADAHVSAATVETLRTRSGLTGSPVERYLQWLGSFVGGDLGFSLTHREAVSSVLWERAGNTLILTGPAMLLTWALALPLGTWAGRRRGSLSDRILSGATSALLALPDLLIALLLLLVALRTGLFPTGGMHSAAAAEMGPAARLLDLGSHALLPLCALVAGTLPAVVRHVRASVIEASQAAPVLAARGHGITGSQLTMRYVLPMAANPLISLAGLSIAALLSASLLVEVVMSWPGLGPLLVEALLARDVHVVLSASMLATTLLVAGTLAADLALYAIDPRIRA